VRILDTDWFKLGCCKVLARLPLILGVQLGLRPSGAPFGGRMKSSDNITPGIPIRCLARCNVPSGVESA